jgi:hypothetical protein
VHACDGLPHVQALQVNCLFGLVDEKPQQLLHCDPEPDQAQRLKVFLEPLYLLGTLHEEALASPPLSWEAKEEHLARATKKRMSSLKILTGHRATFQ